MGLSSPIYTILERNWQFLNRKKLGHCARTLCGDSPDKESTTNPSTEHLFLFLAGAKGYTLSKSVLHQSKQYLHVPYFWPPGEEMILKKSSGEMLCYWQSVNELGTCRWNSPETTQSLRKTIWAETCSALRTLCSYEGNNWKHLKLTCHFFHVFLSKSLRKGGWKSVMGEIAYWL